jgi:hypothetical protein
MREVEVIERAVQGLTPAELADFAAWFDAYAAERFDAAMDSGAKSGALYPLADAAQREFRNGVCQPFPFGAGLNANPR